ncbi:MAG: serine hydrolase domain-containing protein [Planctomycetota bacterium]
MQLTEELQQIATACDFSGAASVTREGATLAELCGGFADRKQRRPNAIDTQFGMASVTKGVTALAAASLIESGDLRFDTTLRSLLGDDLHHVDPAVTIEHLLEHTSGVGDYLDEDIPSGDDDYDLDWPVHKLACPRDYLPLLDLAPNATPGGPFKYNNSGYVLLSIAIEAASGKSFYDVCQEAVFDRASMNDTGFFRADDLPSRAAVGYLTDGRSNVFHLPLAGAGDGGLYSTVGDIEKLWHALFDGRIVSDDFVARLTTPRNETCAEGLLYGLGFWIGKDRPTVMLQGCDRGVSARTVYDPESRVVYCVASNTMQGAWPIAKYLDTQLSNLG